DIRLSIEPVEQPTQRLVHAVAVLGINDLHLRWPTVLPKRRSSAYPDERSDVASPTALDHAISPQVADTKNSHLGYVIRLHFRYHLRCTLCPSVGAYSGASSAHPSNRPARADDHG